MRRTLAATSATVFVALVVASNILTDRYGLVFGVVTAGTFTAGLVLAARDAVRETAGIVFAFLCVAVGAAVSFFMASPTLAFASGAAFALAEVFDAFVYEPLRRHSKVRALAASNTVGSIVDTVVFLAIAGFPLWPATGWQVAVKILLSVIVAAPVMWGFRAVLRNRVRPEGA